MKAIIVWTMIIGTTAVIMLGLYQLRDSHIGFSNVCNEFLYPDTCGTSSTQRKD